MITTSFFHGILPRSALLMTLLGCESALAQPMDWDDACKTGSLDLERRNVIDATGYVVEASALVDHGTHYSLHTEAFTELYPGGLSGLLPLTSDSLFYGQPRFDEGEARTGFLVAPDKVVTAQHRSSFAGARIVFGVHNALGTCAPFDAAHIPKDNVRTLGTALHVSPQDFSIHPLDAPVTNRPFLRLRRDGTAREGDSVALAAHTFRLAQRMDFAGLVDSLAGGIPLYRNLHNHVGASGAAVFNLEQGFVETLVAPSYPSCAYVEFVEAGSPPSGHWRIFSLCPADPISINNVLASEIATYVPPVELLTTPLTLVVKRGVLSGPVTVPTTTYTLSASMLLGGGSAIDYEVVVPPPSSHSEPYLALAPGTPTSGTLARGSSIPLVVQTVKPALSPACGTFERKFHVFDRTHGFKDTLKQRIEIARSGFEVLTPGPLALDGIEMPYKNKVALTVRNPYLVPVSLTFRATQNWLKLDSTPGTYAGPAQVTATVAPGATHTVQVGLSAMAELLPPLPASPHKADVTITDDDATCGQTPSTAVPIAFTPGSLTLTVPIGQAVPAAPKSGGSTPITSTITVGENFCITDVLATYGVRSAGFSKVQFDAWRGEARWNVYQPYSLMRVPLLAPGVPSAGGGVGIGPNPTYTCASPGGGQEGCWFFSVGTSSPNPPPTCAQAYPNGDPCRELTETVDTQALGAWTGLLADEVWGGVATQPTVLQWTLRFEGTPVCYEP